MHWNDRVYGESTIDDPALLDLIACPTFQRLRGIRQAGPSALAFPFKDVTRFEHSLGVFLLLRRLGADRREQVAGLLHDVSHTAFSHAVDFLVTSVEQDHHEELKPLFLRRPDLATAIDRLGYAPGDFFDDAIYPLLERPIPWLCADRLDYFLRDSLACGVSTRASVDRTLAHLVVVDRTIAFDDAAVAREAVALFAEMNCRWWAGPVEAYIYNEFAESLREAMKLGALSEGDLLAEDAHVLEKLRSADSPAIHRTLDRLTHFRPELAEGYRPRTIPKNRWLDPPVRVEGGLMRLSELGRAE